MVVEGTPQVWLERAGRAGRGVFSCVYLDVSSRPFEDFVRCRVFGLQGSGCFFFIPAIPCYKYSVSSSHNPRTKTLFGPLGAGMFSQEHSTT